MNSARFATLALGVVLFAGCKKEPPPPPAPKVAVEAKAPAPAVETPRVESSVASTRGTSDPECVGPIDTGVPSEVTIGGKKAELNGYKLVFKDKDEDATAVFGVVGNINEDSGDNLFYLRKYVEFFKAQKAEAIIVSGDTGESSAGIQIALTPLAETGLPIFVIAGNRECRAEYSDALAALQKTHPNVVNMNKVRYVDFDDADLVSLPGYHDKRYLHCETGCLYHQQDVEALKAVAKAANDPVLLVAHGSPHGAGKHAIDAVDATGNVGDPNINGLLSEAGIPFGVFSNIKEAGGRATDMNGEKAVAEDTLSDVLYLNPGSADTVAWKMNDETESRGMVAAVTVTGKQAKFKMFRAKALTLAEKKEAQKLAPAAAPEKEAPAKAAEK